MRFEPFDCTRCILQTTFKIATTVMVKSIRLAEYLTRNDGLRTFAVWVSSNKRLGVIVGHIVSDL